MSIVPPGMSLKEVRRYMAAESRQYGAELVPLDTDGSGRPKPPNMLRAWRSRSYLVQEYAEDSPQVLVRLSVSRTILNDKGGWLDGITWDQLQAIKTALGYHEHDAVEVYPRQRNVVNVANIRHLWVMREPLPFAWGAKP